MSNEIKLTAFHKSANCAIMVLLLLMLAACQSHKKHESTTALCSQEWFEQVEKRLVSADEQGHGPDVGSMEWRSVVEFRLGVRGSSDVPDRDSKAWCEFIEKKLSSAVDGK